MYPIWLNKANKQIFIVKYQLKLKNLALISPVVRESNIHSTAH